MEICQLDQYIEILASHTLFRCLHGPDEVVYETLEVTNRVGNACSPVNLR